ncbi:CpaD family pilus assembly lipoprotein [Kordiimonas gwangyangensis]|uniref:CpaD family pilus assembly lipoprotein n=1 Tax=Kordiimonas gwangyangensis TaxID=288022 RepID=UPI0003752EE5|nr:CpaD family pilus assembly lipoprotein [Kordiimonas gwangyangensis]
MTHTSKTFAAALLKPALLGIALLSTTACVHDQIANPVSGEVVNRNAVTMVRLAHMIQAEDDGTDTPSAAVAANLHAFLASVDAGYGDIVMIDSGASPARTAAIAKMIKARGLVYGGEAPLGETPAIGDIALYVERYVVTTPNCGVWPNEPTNNTRNNASSYYGCANTANLGLMVADPRDLVAGRNGGNSTGAAVAAIYSPKAKAKGPAVTVSFADMPVTTGAGSTGGGAGGGDAAPTGK